jgi:hypothetical protein
MMMATRIIRARVRPTWTAGLRRGRERNSTMKYLQSSPEEYKRLLRIIQRSRAAGYEPMPMTGVRQPFGYERRKTPLCCYRSATRF